MKFQLPPLAYAHNALEPYVSAETLKYHHDVHHKNYVTKLNELVKGTQWESASLEDIVRNSSGEIFNNAGQVWNHSFYWKCLSPQGGGVPEGRIGREIVSEFDTFDAFQRQFAHAAESRFGSGWVWLVCNGDGKLEVMSTGNAETPLTAGLRPLLTCDVWEHAYYIDYRNSRKNYLEAFWNILNWNFAEENLARELEPA